MNLEHAVQTIAKRGFTDRQARFLVLVARHSGVCVMRQYSSFAGIVFGQKTRMFFAKLVRLGFVSTYDCAHNRGRVYHVRHRAIYEAIGEPDSRLRRPPGVPRALERLMLLDAILENPERIWMSAPAEKIDYFSSRGIPTDDAPRLVIRQGDQQRVRYFPDRLPIGVHPSGHVVFVYLHADPLRGEFRDFLQRHAPLLERLPAWTIRIVVPAHLEGAAQTMQKAAWGQLASPLKDPILTELRCTSSASPALLPRRARRSIALASSGVAAPSAVTATRCFTDAGDRMASRCWQLHRRPSSGRRWSQGPERSSRWCCRMPTATWHRWRAWHDSGVMGLISIAQSNKYRYFKHMKSSGPGVREYVTGLARSGRYLFSSDEAQVALGVSASAAKVALNRLARQGLVSSPARGYYVVVPPEYHSLGCLPAEQFVPTLMDRLGLQYYAGLLTAAEHHGAAHQRPQEFQVFLEQPRRPLVCGRVRVAFITRKRLKDVPVQSLNTPRGTLLISTPEATALDLVGYQHRAGGLNQVATVLAELSEQLDADKLVAVAATAPPAWSQRLGFLLERVDAAEKAAPLKAWVRSHARDAAVLLPDAHRHDAERDREWKLYLNTLVEPEL